MVYLPERDINAVGGYMISREKKALCALVDFKEASSKTDACVEAFYESLQCAIEDFKAKNMKSWIRNFSVSERNISDFVWLNLWKGKCYQYGTRQVLQAPIN